MKACNGNLKNSHCNAGIRIKTRRASAAVLLFLSFYSLACLGNTVPAQSGVSNVIQNSTSVLQIAVSVRGMTNNLTNQQLSDIGDTLNDVIVSQEQLIDWLDSMEISLRHEIEVAFRNDIQRELAAEIYEFRLIALSSLDSYSAEAIQEKIRRMRILLLRILNHGPSAFSAINAGLSVIFALHRRANIDMESTNYLVRIIADRYEEWTTSEDYQLARRIRYARDHLAVAAMFRDDYRHIAVANEIHRRGAYTRIDQVLIEVWQQDPGAYEIEVLVSEGYMIFAPGQMIPEVYRIPLERNLATSLLEGPEIRALSNVLPSIRLLEERETHSSEDYFLIEHDIESFLRNYVFTEDRHVELRDVISFGHAVDLSSSYLRSTI